MSHRLAVLAAIITLVFVQGAAAVEPAAKCEAGKVKEAAKYASCRLKADWKALLKGTAVDYSRCYTRFWAKFPGLETKVGSGVCPTEGDVASEEAALTADAVATAWRLSGEGRFIDNGDGTITDRRTNLMWEKKVKLDGSDDLANPHDADNEYVWAGQCTISGAWCQPNEDASYHCLEQVEGDTTGCAECGVGEGTCFTFGLDTIWEFRSDVSGFAGYTDWRVPTLAELESLRDVTVSAPAVDAALHGASCGTACDNLGDLACSCTRSDVHWSSTTYADFPSRAWTVGFYDGTVFSYPKDNTIGVRAVRGGS